eukprot:CAMPEP_0117651658 /NCGR_PEP_ID=MMETSP0804-20121206/2212_1 /TAXON_ID=1074897 /ORGANISM="Tetraselmis astigmatica, Strain CCMP880" /LENGTH=317 /DNA_ID=CAMNT_0005457655 /DNA_START=26 /DNA_END=977 /DNA_ORIENTATION=+
MSAIRQIASDDDEEEEEFHSGDEGASVVSSEEGDERAGSTKEKDVPVVLDSAGHSAAGKSLSAEDPRTAGPAAQGEDGDDAAEETAELEEPAPATEAKKEKTEAEGEENGGDDDEEGDEDDDEEDEAEEEEEEAEEAKPEPGKKEAAPFEVPTTGAFYMHDDRGGDDGKQRRPGARKKLWEGKKEEKWAHDKFESLSFSPDEDHDEYQSHHYTRGRRGRGRGQAHGQARGRGRGRGRDGGRYSASDRATNQQQGDTVTGDDQWPSLQPSDRGSRGGRHGDRRGRGGSGGGRTGASVVVVPRPAEASTIQDDEPPGFE